MRSSRRNLLGVAGLGGGAILAAAAAPTSPSARITQIDPALGIDRPLQIVSLGDVEAEAQRTMSKAAPDRSTAANT